MNQPEAPGGRRESSHRLARATRSSMASPLGHQALPVEVRRFVGRSQAKAIEMEHRPAGALIAVHQRVGRAGGRPGDAETAGDRLDQRRLPCSELAFERDQLSRP